MYQKCPICNGSGIEPDKFSMNTSVKCSVCSGKKIISVVTGNPPKNETDSTPVFVPFITLSNSEVSNELNSAALLNKIHTKFAVLDFETEKESEKERGIKPIINFKIKDLLPDFNKPKSFIECHKCHGSGTSKKSKTEICQTCHGLGKLIT